MLEVRHLSRFGLEDCSFQVHPGECLVVQGASGAGKTLLLRALADLDPCEGEILLNGVARAAVSGPHWRRAVGYVPAEPGWWAENVAAHFSDCDTARSLAERVGVGRHVFDRPVATASTGERLRLGLVRALLSSPDMLMLDEPTAALDPASTALVEDLVQDHLRRGKMVLWTTHDPAQARRMGQRRLVIAQGRVTQEPLS